jgi:hypothetical protein
MVHDPDRPRNRRSQGGGWAPPMRPVPQGTDGPKPVKTQRGGCHRRKEETLVIKREDKGTDQERVVVTFPDGRSVRMVVPKGTGKKRLVKVAASALGLTVK